MSSDTGAVSRNIEHGWLRRRTGRSSGDGLRGVRQRDDDQRHEPERPMAMETLPDFHRESFR